MQVTSISAFRANIKQYYDEVLLTEEPLIVTKGDTGAVLLPLKEFNAMQRSAQYAGNEGHPRSHPADGCWAVD